MKAIDLKSMSDAQIKEALLENLRALFTLRMRLGFNPAGVKTHQFKVCKKNIARMKTELKSRGVTA